MSTQAKAGPRPVRAPRGTEISCRGWQQEAALRMLMNNLDPEVAEDPDKLIVYGGAGKAARDWECFDTIVRTLRRLKDDETLLVQSGKPVGVFETHEMAPRVLIANANLVGDWANWDEFRRLDHLGLTMYGQMTAGSWIYIGTQGILQGTYQTFAAAGQKHYGADLAGKLVLTAGLGGMGGAQPLAVTMAGGVALCVEVDPHRIQRRLETAYVDVAADSLDEALKLADEAMAARKPLSIALLGNAADVYPELVRRGVVPDLVTDQTSAHDVLNGYVPNGMTLDEALVLRREDPDEYVRRAVASIVVHVEAMVALQKAGAHAFDYGNNIRGVAKEAGYADAFAFPGFVPGVHPAALLPRQRAVPLGGAQRRPAGHRGHRRRAAQGVPGQRDGHALDQDGRREGRSSRACPAASAGSSTASAPRPARSSTTWCAAARSRRRSSSAATISTPVRSRARTARPRA